MPGDAGMLDPHELDPAELPEDVTLLIVNALAMPGFPPPVPGAELRPCHVCHRDTWAAPSSIAAEQIRTTLHVCRRCGAGFAVMTRTRGAGRLPGADADARAPGSLVDPDVERRLARDFPGR